MPPYKPLSCIFYIRMENQRHAFNRVQAAGGCPVDQIGINRVDPVVFYRRHIAEFIPKSFDGVEMMVIDHRRENNDFGGRRNDAFRAVNRIAGNIFAGNIDASRPFNHFMNECFFSHRKHGFQAELKKNARLRPVLDSLINSI